MNGLFPFIVLPVIIWLKLNEGGRKMNTEKVGTNIATLRKRKGITQNELGERIGVSFQAVSKWERVGSRMCAAAFVRS